jgi:branched-chain amino acid transport system permease protein
MFRPELLSILAINAITLAAVLFLLSAGLSVIFGLQRIPNLAHGSLFLLGGYLGLSLTRIGADFWSAAVGAALLSAALGGLVERLLLRRLAGANLAQVLLTLGLSFMIADVCLKLWSGDAIPIDAPEALSGSVRAFGLAIPSYRLFLIVFALVLWLGLRTAVEKTRLGAMVRAGVDDPAMARCVGIPVSRLFTAVFSTGAGLAGLGGFLAGPVFSVYPGLDVDMLSLALVVVVLGGAGSLAGAAIGSLAIGILYNFGQVAFPQLAYVMLFLPMVAVLVLRPAGLFGREAP